MSWNGVKKQTNIENIKAWCEEMGIQNYTINSRGEIDVDGDVNLYKINLKELPHKFGRVSGFFDIGSNQNLISLKNCPDYVGVSFSCSSCSKLKSLEGCPNVCDRDFYCRSCKREFTKEEIMSLCKVERHMIN